MSKPAHFIDETGRRARVFTAGGKWKVELKGVGLIASKVSKAEAVDLITSEGFWEDVPRQLVLEDPDLPGATLLDGQLSFFEERSRNA